METRKMCESPPLLVMVEFDAAHQKMRKVTAWQEESSSQWWRSRDHDELQIKIVRIWRLALPLLVIFKKDMGRGVRSSVIVVADLLITFGLPRV